MISFYEFIHETFGTSKLFFQTSKISVYNIKGINGLQPIQIIYTKLFWDTKGIKQDKIITSKIEKVIKEALNSFNAIGIVAQSSNDRLEKIQKYFFTSVLDLFGENIKENFIAILTFCNGEIPQVVALLEDPNCVFSSVIQKEKKL